MEENCAAVRTLVVEPEVLARVADRLDAIADRPPILASSLQACLSELESAWSGGTAARLACDRLRQLIGLASAAPDPPLDLLPAHERDRLNRARYPGGLPLLDRSDALLLQYDERGDGRIVVAFGDPDTSRNVATYVPGAGTSLRDVSGELERAVALRERAGPDTAVVMWLGYDAPDFADAALLKAARDGADALRRFQEGLAANHTGEIGQRTVIGHSYGSVVVGVAEREGDLIADDIVALGSPGMGAPTAAHLRDPTQVWACTARDDPIRLVPGFILGRDPDHPRFGAQRFVSAPMGHSGYFHPTNPALDALARIATTGTA